MQRYSIGRSSSAGRISLFEREDRNLRNEQRRTQTLKSREGSEGSHIPRPRFRSSSSDRAGSLSRKSHLKVPGKTSLYGPATPSTPGPSRQHLLSIGLTASSSKSHTPICRPISPSVDRNFLSKKNKKDSRPLADKGYQMELLCKIDNFFHSNDCAGMLNNGSFKSLTLKMFVDVSAFLLKMLDINEDLTTTNYIEQIPKCAKKLHYPGMMNKSWLKTANTMHSWPYALGWVGWLVEVCQVKQIAVEKYQLETLPFMGFNEEEMESCRKEFCTLLDCYTAWTEEKLDVEEEIIERYFKDMTIQQGITQEDIAETHAKLKGNSLLLESREKELQQIDERNKQLREKLALLEAKEATLLNNIKSKEEYINKITHETSLLNVKHDTLKEQIKVGNSKRKELILVVKSQPMSKPEKEALEEKCTVLQNYVQEFDVHLNDYKKEVYNLDIKLARITNDLTKTILEYDKEVFMLADTDAEVNFDKLKLPEMSPLDPQMMSVLKEKIVLTKTIREFLAKQCNEMESVIRSNASEIEKLEETMNSLPNDDELKQERFCVDKLKKKKKKEKTKMLKKIENVKTDINNLEKMVPDINAIDREIEEAKDKLDAVTRRKAFLEQKAEEFFEQLYTIIGNHRRELKNILENIK